jgi:hypothetical protein
MVVREGLEPSTSEADAEFLLAQQRYTDASPLLGRRFYDEITKCSIGSLSILSAISNSTRRRAAYSPTDFHTQ